MCCASFPLRMIFCVLEMAFCHFSGGKRGLKKSRSLFWGLTQLVSFLGRQAHGRPSARPCWGPPVFDIYITPSLSDYEAVSLNFFFKARMLFLRSLFQNKGSLLQKSHLRKPHPFPVTWPAASIAFLELFSGMAFSSSIF